MSPTKNLNLIQMLSQNNLKMYLRTTRQKKEIKKMRIPKKKEKNLKKMTSLKRRTKKRKRRMMRTTILGTNLNLPRSS